MRTLTLVNFLALPACLKVVCAEQVNQVPRVADDPTYDSELHSNDQDLFRGVPCPDYTRYATKRQ